MSFLLGLHWSQLWRDGGWGSSREAGSQHMILSAQIQDLALSRGTCVRIRVTCIVPTWNMQSSHMELDRDFDYGQCLWFHRASSLIIRKVPWFCSRMKKENIFIYFNITLALSDDSWALENTDITSSAHLGTNHHLSYVSTSHSPKKGFVLCISCRKCNKLHTERQNKNNTWLFYWIVAHLLGKTSL